MGSGLSPTEPSSLSDEITEKGPKAIIFLLAGSPPVSSGASRGSFHRILGRKRTKGKGARGGQRDQLWDDFVF